MSESSTFLTHASDQFSRKTSSPSSKVATSLQSTQTQLALTSSWFSTLISTMETITSLITL